MQNLSNNIEQYILRCLEGVDDNVISLRRKELADMFECVPSQINYVLRSRFSPEHGYIIESRRGEHGYIKIFRIACSAPEEKADHIDDIVGDTISLYDAHKLLKILGDRKFISYRERLLVEIALRHLDETLAGVLVPRREKIFAGCLKRMLKGLVLDEAEEFDEGDED